MKLKIITLLIVGLFATSCGASNLDSNLSNTQMGSDPFDNSPMSVSNIKPSKTEITHITKSMVNMPDVVFTRIALAFDLYCHHELLPMSHHTLKNKETLNVYISAHQSVSKLALVSNCTNDKTVIRHIDIKGKIAKENLQIQFNQMPHKSINMKVSKIYKNKDITLTSVESKDCNNLPSCFVSTVTLHVGTSGCADDAVVSHRYAIDGKKVKLIVSAFTIGNEKSKSMRCFAQNRVPIQIRLPVKTTKKDIELIIH